MNKIFIVGNYYSLFVTKLNQIYSYGQFAEDVVLFLDTFNIFFYDEILLLSVYSSSRILCKEGL